MSYSACEVNGKVPASVHQYSELWCCRATLLAERLDPLSGRVHPLEVFVGCALWKGPSKVYGSLGLRDQCKKGAECLSCPKAILWTAVVEAWVFKINARKELSVWLEQSVMSKSQVLESLRSFFPYMTAREVKDLVGPGNLSTDKLRNLLFHPDVPVRDGGHRVLGNRRASAEASRESFMQDELAAAARRSVCYSA
eukprot:1154255-Pelagomonas_calceolata.AAC.5